MLIKRSSGFTLVELVIFIVVLGISATALMMGLNQALKYSDIPRSNTEASFLANARMQIILMNRNVSGYASLNDPCTSTPSLAICTPLSAYASANSLTVATPVISGNNPKTISVSVSGVGSASISASVYNYAND